MVIDEIFPNPTVKQVIFQITFPNLFYLEKRIGDIQEKIMEQFPKSDLLLRRGILLADIGPDQKIEFPPNEIESSATKKIWHFEAKNKTQLNISSNSLDLSSEFHKTYNFGEKDKFRDVIEHVIGTFIEIAGLPIINRIGLRYIDHCPLPTKDNETLKQYYNSKFPTDKFNIANADTMAFRAVVKEGRYYLGYVESLQQIKGETKLILDFDGSATDVKNSSDYLTISDELHDLISKAYKETIKDPVYAYMRQTTKIEG